MSGRAARLALVLAGATLATAPTLHATSAADRAATTAPSTVPTTPRPDPSTTATTTTVPDLAPRRAPTPEGPLRTVLVGDSVADTLAPGLERALADAGLGFLLSRAFPGFGFTSPWPGIVGGQPWPPAFEGWPEELSRQVEASDPDAVLVFAGGWDLVDRVVGDRTLVPFTPEWRAWYDGLLDDAVRRLSARGAVVYWLALPCDPRPDHDAANRRMDEVFSALAARWPGVVAHVPLDSFLCPGGGFSPTLPGPLGDAVDVWSPTLHLTEPGADLTGAWIVARMAPDWIASAGAAAP